MTSLTCAFPRRDEFFPLLLAGKWTLAECYWSSPPMARWRLTLIGDPLYNPFHANPQLKPSDLPRGSRQRELTGKHASAEGRGVSIQASRDRVNRKGIHSRRGR